MTESERDESIAERAENRADVPIAGSEITDVSVHDQADAPRELSEQQHEQNDKAPGTTATYQAEHRYSREELLSFSEHDSVKSPPKDLQESGIYRELLGTLFTVRDAPEGPPMDEVRLRPGGSFPIRDQEPPRPIPNGPPGVPRDGNPSSWKEHDNSWRSPFKGSPSGNQPIRSRLVDDSPAVISPPGGPPGLNMRRGPPDGPPGTGEWHSGSEGWRRAGGPPQEWRGPPGPMGEEDEAMSPRRHGSGRPSQDMDKWGSSKLPGRNESAWRAGAPPGRGVARGNEWNARRGRGAPPQAPGKGTPPPGFDGPPGFPTKPVLKEGRGAGGQAQEQGRNGKAAVPDAKPRGLEGDWRAAKEKSAADPDRLSLDGAPEGESQAERMRREFEEERLRLQEERKKGGHTAQRAANETIGDLLGDDELEEMRLRENEEAGQGNRNGSSAPVAPANTAGQLAKPPKEQEQQPAKALQPPPGFSANHLFGDVEDDDPLDLVTNLSFLNDNEEEEKPALTKEKSSRFANFFSTSAPAAAAGPAAPAGIAAPGSNFPGPPALQHPSQGPPGGQALLQQLQAANRAQEGQGPAGQQDLLAKLAQAAAAHPHLQRAVPKPNARTLDDIEAAVRANGPPNNLRGAYQQDQQSAKPPGNALLSLLQANAAAAHPRFGQDGGGSQRGDGTPRARSDGPPQPALDPLLAHFSAMGMAQNARQNTPLPQQQQQQQHQQQQQNPLGQGLNSFGASGAAAGQQNTLASLLAGAYSQMPGQSAGMGNQGMPLNLLQQQEQLLRARASLPGQVSVQLPGAMPLAQNLPQNFAGLQQQAQQPNLAHLNQFLPQQQARPQALNEHQQNILRLLQQQQQRQQALQIQQQLQQQQRLAQLQAQAQQQRMTPLQALQMQLQLQQQLGRQQQQMAGQQNFGAAAGNGLERFFNANTMTAAQRAAAMPAQAGARPTHEELERRFNAPH